MKTAHIKHYIKCPEFYKALNKVPRRHIMLEIVIKSPYQYSN